MKHTREFASQRQGTIAAVYKHCLSQSRRMTWFNAVLYVETEMALGMK